MATSRPSRDKFRSPLPTFVRGGRLRRGVPAERSLVEPTGSALLGTTQKEKRDRFSLQLQRSLLCSEEGFDLAEVVEVVAGDHAPDVLDDFVGARP